MTDRILEISDEPARLAVRNSLLVIRRASGEEVTIPLADLAVLVVSHPQVSYTQAVLAGLVAQGGAFVTCNPQHLPVGMLLPLDAHYIQAERFAVQVGASLPLRKRLWREIVRAKVRAQGLLLSTIHGNDAGLIALATQVRSGDPSNIEAQASRRYWPALFANLGFRRDRDAQDQNRLLNYGYTILRAATARAICAAGLHPSLGVHHHNRYDAFRLADDLMEPFRPRVDQVVVSIVRQDGPTAPLDQGRKERLVKSITGRLDLRGESRTLFDSLARAATSLAGVYGGTLKKLTLPDP